MFGRLQEMLRRSLAPTLELNALETYLGTQYAADFRNFLEGKYARDDSLKKRACGLSYLGKSIIKTRQFFQDDEGHEYFWKEIAKGTIDLRYAKTFTGQYDPARFYLDALDFSAVTILFPVDRNLPVSKQMIENFQALNAREASNGGYFGNTPYWALYNHQVWRMIDARFTSVQAYWFLLMLIDNSASELSLDINKAILSQSSFISSLSLQEKERLITEDILTISHYFCLGGLSFCASNPSNPRFDSLSAIMNSIAPNSSQAFRTALSASIVTGISALKSLVDENHLLHSLGKDVCLDILLKAAFQRQAALLMHVIEVVGSMSPDENVIDNPNENAPHLFHASR